MTILSVEQRYGNLTTQAYTPGGVNYDQTKLNLASLMCQKTGATNLDKYCSPFPIAVARPMEQSTTIASVFPWAYQWSSTIDWIFLADWATATTSRRINFYKYDRTTNEFSWQGFVICNMVGTGNHTVRGFRMTYDKYTTGTAAASGTAVTGTATTWQTDRIAAGGRIGFGSTDPTQIVTWYEIAAITGEGAITLSSSAGTVGSGAYVIEELRAVLATTSSVANQGGLYAVKGLRPEIFTTTGQFVAAGVAAATPGVSATLGNHTSTGTRIQITTSAAHNISVGQVVTLNGTWTWDSLALGGGATYTVLQTLSTTTFVIAPSPCPSAGTNPAAVGTLSLPATADNLRANYWLADASTALNQASNGVGLMSRTDWQTHYVFVIDLTGTTLTLYKYNLRAALTLTAGKDTANGIQLKTGTYVTVGTAAINNNGRIVTASHGPGSGVQCLYFVTTTRIYRTKDVTTITAADVAYIADMATEVPPGSVNTFAASSLMNSIEYSTVLDKFVVMLNVSNTPFRHYVTRYNTVASQFDRVFLTDLRQIDQSSADGTTTPSPSILARAFSIWTEGGVWYLAGLGTTAQTNILYAIPFAADWEYAATTGQRIIGPVMSTPNCDTFQRAYFNNIDVVGGRNTLNLGQAPEPFRCYYRTTGISNDSGAWTLLDDMGDISGISGASSIQFMYEFRTIGQICVPARVLSATVLYNDLSTDSHFQPSAGLSDRVNKRFAWRFSTAFGTTVPTLRIRLYDAVSGGLLVDDSSSPSPTGTWEKSTDGSSFVTWNTTDKTNDTTYLRFTPASLADNIRVRALLTLG